MDLDLFFQGVRVLVILLGCCAMWSLWIARRERQHLWTSKLKKIWTIQMGWAIVSVDANTELLYRHVRPTSSIIIVIVLLILTMMGVFDKSKYTIE